MGFQPLVEPVPDGGFDQSLHLGVAQLGLGLPLKLRLGQLDAQDGREPLPHVVTGERRVPVLEQPAAPGVVIDGPRQGRAESRQVRAALGRRDGVHVRKHVFQVRLVVLEGALHFHTVALFHGVHHGGELGLGAIQVRYQLGDTAGVLEGLVLAAALVADRDDQAFVEIGDVVQPLRDRGGIKVGCGHHLPVGFEGDARAGLARAARFRQRRGLLAAGKPLLPRLAVAPDLHLQPLGQRVGHRNADPMQAAGDLVSAASELSTGVQGGQHDFNRRAADLGDRINRNAGAVVNHGGTAVLVEHDVDLRAPAGERLIDRVVDHLIEEVVQPIRPGAANVHRRALANTLQPLQNLNLFCGVGRRSLVCRRAGVFAHKNPFNKPGGAYRGRCPSRMMDSFGPCRRLRHGSVLAERV